MGSRHTESSVPGVPKSWREDSVQLLAEIEEIERRVDMLDLAYSGLKDLDDMYHLVRIKLDVAFLLLHHSDKRDLKERAEIASIHAQSALFLSDSLQTANISLDQKDEIVESEEMAEIRDKLQQLVLFGGASLFEAGDVEHIRTRRVSFALRKALLKYTGGQHQMTGEKDFKEDHLAQYEIREGEEDILLSDQIVLPLSQAVLLLEEEILPAVERRLEAQPGDPDLIRQKLRLQERLADYKATRFFPRARPATFEKDLFTTSLSGFSAEGEALVTVDLPSIQSSGNTYDHLVEHIKLEIVRDCAGIGISDSVDEQVRKTRSAEAGRRYSMTEVLNKLNIPDLYRVLSLQFPFLRRIENRDDLKVLADLASQKRKGDLHRLISAMAREDHNLLTTSTKRLQFPPN